MGMHRVYPEIVRSPRLGCAPLKGRTLLVHHEQGWGDTLQFARYVKLLTAAGEKVLFEVPEALIPLLKKSGFTKLIAEGSKAGKADVVIAIMSLPRVFGTTLETIPADVPYLSAGSQLVKQWSKVLKSIPGLRVGITWQGYSGNANDQLRSIPLACFAPLALPGVQLISLQKGPGVEQLTEVANNLAVRHLGQFDEERGAFMDTAAVMKNLDLVITCDTAIAHLAGGLGVPVWVALQLAPDWRWMLARRDSPWYPTMRLFRQKKFGDWPGVFADMADELKQLLRPEL